MRRNPGPHSPILAVADDLDARATDLGMTCYRSALAGGGAVVFALGACVLRVPGRPLGYLLLAGVAAGVGWTVHATWARWRRACRRAGRRGSAVRRFAGEWFTWLCLHGRRSPGGESPPRPGTAATPGTDARGCDRTEDGRRRDGAVAAAA